MNRVLSYIDGLNLYHGLRSREWKKYYWLDLVGLTQRLLKQQQILEAVHYFTSTILPKKRVIVAWPPERRSEDLRRAATASTSISETALRLSQLPATVTSESGHLLKRPKEWH